MRHGPYEQEGQLRMQDAQRAELLSAANDQGILLQDSTLLSSTRGQGALEEA